MSKNTTKRAVVTTVAALAIAGGLLLYNTTGAQADSETGSDTFISALATRFNLNADEVSSFFQEQREARQAERETERSKKLEQAVTDGVITAEQKAALEAQHETMKAEMEANRESGEKPSEEDRESRREAMETWAEEQGIDLEALHEYMRPEDGGQHRRGPR